MPHNWFCPCKLRRSLTIYSERILAASNICVVKSWSNFYFIALGHRINQKSLQQPYCIQNQIKSKKCGVPSTMVYSSLKIASRSKRQIYQHNLTACFRYCPMHSLSYISHVEKTVLGNGLWCREKSNVQSARHGTDAIDRPSQNYTQ